MEKAQAQTDTTKEESKNASLKEVYKTSKWAWKMFFSINPFYSTIFLIFSILLNFRDIVNTYVLAKIIDEAIKIAQQSDASLQKIIWLIGAMFAVNIVLVILRFVHRQAVIALNTSSTQLLRRALYTKIHNLGIETLEQPEVNNKIFRADDNLNNVIGYFTNLINLIQSIVQLVATAIILMRFAPLLIPILAIVSIPRFLTDKKYRKLAHRLIIDNTEPRRASNTTASDLINTSKLQEVFINNSFSFLDTKYIKFQLWLIKETIKNRRDWFLRSTFYGILADIAIYASYIFIFAKLIAKQITVGTVVFQTRMLNIFADSLYSGVQFINDLADLSLRIKDTYELFETNSSVKDGEITLPILQGGIGIEFKNVSFKYPNSEKFVIEDLNMKISPGEKVAIVGHNGAGKTTLVRLINRMYQVTSGQVLINNTDIKDLKINSFYQNTSVLFQDYSTFPQLTVKENIIIGDPTKEINEERVIDSAKNADALGFIEEYPKKFDTILSEKYKGGIRPSTGQWQKIAIARFFYRDTPLVIFDEPTAAIDAISEYTIFNKIYEFFKGKTVVIISHRFSTVRNADRIIVMEHGKIIEEGSHDKLMELNGQYAKSFLLQAHGYKIN